MTHRRRLTAIRSSDYGTGTSSVDPSILCAGNSAVEFREYLLLLLQTRENG